MSQPSYQSLPKKPGVYIFSGKPDKVLYVGKAKNLRERVRSYFLSRAELGPKTAILVSKIQKIDHLVVESEFESLLLEAALIKKHQPKYNIRLKDDKSYLYLKITKEDFPRVFAARRTDILGGDFVYFGPFPSAKTVRQVLSILRKIFPYRSCRKLPRKPCLYFSLKLCPGLCVLPEKKKDYRQTLNRLLDLLRGKSQKVLLDLRREMQRNAGEEKFEEAANVRDQMAKINRLLEPIRPPFEYLETPNLLEDQRREEIENLQKILLPYFPDLTGKLERLEAYDISNLSGQKATGSMVVFRQGEKDPSEYRRFRVKIEGKPNDVAMMKEVLSRRLAHFGWEKPDLILVDGGKGQVGATIEVLNNLRLKIPVIGLAKRLETIIVPKLKIKIEFTEINLPKNSPSLNLLKRIRDEAHRFALSYHHWLRQII